MKIYREKGAPQAAALPLLEIEILMFQFIGWFGIQFAQEQANIGEAAHNRSFAT